VVIEGNTKKRHESQDGTCGKLLALPVDWAARYNKNGAKANKALVRTSQLLGPSDFISKQARRIALEYE
jgi:hypothetical protein